VSLSVVLDDALELAREKIRAAGIEIRIHSEKLARLRRVKGRPAQLGQVVVNLINNAFDAVRDLPQKWIEIDANEGPGVIEIQITDSGRGIPPEVVQKIMEPFFTTKGVGQGTGLGLSISRSIAQEHGGDLRYDSASKQTRFILTLPSAP